MRSVPVTTSAKRFVSLLILAFAATLPVEAAVLSFEERVEAQRAIERVYWAHRIWPKDNPGPKPPLEAVMDDAALRAKVEDYLKKSNALEVDWGRPITADQLQAEMDRMAAGTRNAAVLQELFAALDNDPFLIAECLARPALADRLLRNWYAGDERFHAEVRHDAERAVATGATITGLGAMGRSVEMTWRLASDSMLDDDPEPGALRLDPEEWADLVGRLASGFGVASSTDTLPVGSVTTLLEDEGAFFVTTILEKAEDRLKTATVLWDKTAFDSWWSAQGVASTDPGVTGESFDLPALRGAGCTDNTWTPTSLDRPDPRYWHTAVWTGTEMIVWGGHSGNSNLATGGRYNPATDTWAATSLSGAPAPRLDHEAVWTGTKMIVWGGDFTNTGGRYDPVSDTWSPTTTVGAPCARDEHTAIWTGSEMIVWGGWSTCQGSETTNGGRYDPVSDTWASMAVAPQGRRDHTATWTGTEMIVFGGWPSLAVAHRYNPSTNSWTVSSPAAAARTRNPAVVWTGTGLIVWGGNDAAGGCCLNTGEIYNPGSNSWTPTTTVNAPTARYWMAVAWTGSRLVVWGGSGTSGGGVLASGGRYDPVSNTWTPTSNSGAPRARYQQAAVWTGTEMIVWGGSGAGSADYIGDGGRYDPVSDTWVPTGTGQVPMARRDHTAVWTGSEMIVWGGNLTTSSAVPVTATGSRYDPALDAWTATTSANAPAARNSHTAVWTGSRMIVWGGTDGVAAMSTGSRYDPVLNTWAGTGGASPVPRSRHTAVWTGSEMIVWGGVDSSSLNSGGRYDPVSDAWTTTDTTTAPAARRNHTAVWTGTEMIVWGGGTNTSGANTGGRYSPGSNLWTPTSTVGGPSARELHTAVWTGSEMIVWGGAFGGGSLNTGARYTPGNDTWAAMATPGASRSDHTAVWNGVEMLVWGGTSSVGDRYNPTNNLWRSMSASNLTGRSAHAAVWTGDDMIVWGGTNITATGGLYCACHVPTTIYRDVDMDQYGIATTTAIGCQEAPPAGWALVSGDCNDNAATVFPGAPQLCDGINNDCSDPSWPAVPANEANADGDGFRICAGDCDDTNSTVRPGAPQLCDGINNNCSDPGWPTPPANESDGDMDGFRICAGDCNDGSAAVNPGATEVCNGINDDCDAFTDEDALGEDSDGDGVKNLCDNCVLASNASQLDTDMDGDGNACDNCITVSNPDQADPDMDSRGTVCDNCPIDSNPTQDDTDADLVGDVCDNCLFDWNAGQGDVDSDFEGDVCDFDDGLIYEFRTGEDYIEWQAETGPTLWNVYEGDLDVLRSTGVYTQPPGPLVDQHCGVSDLFVEDFDVPPVGKAVFTLVTWEGSLESLGQDSHGLERPNANPCP